VGPCDRILDIAAACVGATTAARRYLRAVLLSVAWVAGGHCTALHCTRTMPPYPDTDHDRHNLTYRDTDMDDGQGWSIEPIHQGESEEEVIQL
jgi:hypothetical protein